MTAHHPPRMPPTPPARLPSARTVRADRATTPSGAERHGQQRRSPLRAARIALLSLCCLLWVRPAGAQFFSPGPLAQAHSAIDGDSSCGECHSAGNRVSDDRCAVCHDDVKRTVEQRTGLHGRQHADQSCGSCHVDHRGRGHKLIRWDEEDFDHSLTGFELRGQHRTTKCRECHDGKNRRGNPTYIGLDPACGACHQDKHQGRLGFDCESCHQEESWKTVDLEDFDHDLSRFPLKGRHEEVKCAKCHGEPPLYEPIPFEDCGNCHDDPHGGRFQQPCASCHQEDGWKSLRHGRSDHPGLSIRGGHSKVDCKTCHDRGTLVAPSRGSECVDCHSPVHKAPFGDNCARCHTSIRWLGLPDRVGRREHKRTVFPLVGQHRSVACDQCHKPELPQAARYRQLAFERCSDCHKDPHAGQFRTRAENGCDACHTESGFAPTTFGVTEHALSEFALTGLHVAAPCAECHTGARPRLDWQLEKRACASCHENPHGDQFEREMAEGGCGHCHSTAGWSVPTIDHSTWPLTGAHERAQCDQCHTPTEADRRAGSGVSYQQAPRQCNGCHEDIHLGQFRISDPVVSCEGCHDTGGFKIPEFDHATQARYPLVGRHAAIACGACHSEQTWLAPDGRELGQAVLYRLPYNECRDCHADPHSPRARAQAHLMPLGESNLVGAAP